MQQIQEIKLKWYQIRLVHRIIATNIVLMHMGIENDITCSFCRQDRDSINHICDRPPRNESEVPSGCLELERKMGVGGVRCRF